MTFQEWYDQLPAALPHGHVAQMRMAWEAALRASQSEAEGEVQRNAVDAERYRWMRDTAKGQAAGGDDYGNATITLCLHESLNGRWLAGPTNLDFAIDDARGRSEGDA